MRTFKLSIIVDVEPLGMHSADEDEYEILIVEAAKEAAAQFIAEGREWDEAAEVL